MVNAAPVREDLTTMPPVWVLWFRSIASALKFSGQSYTVAKLPPGFLGAVTVAWDGRKATEGAGAGTGCPVWWDGSVWRTFYDNSQVAA